MAAVCNINPAPPPACGVNSSGSRNKRDDGCSPLVVGAAGGEDASRAAPASKQGVAVVVDSAVEGRSDGWSAARCRVEAGV